MSARMPVIPGLPRRCQAYNRPRQRQCRRHARYTRVLEDGNVTYVCGAHFTIGVPMQEAPAR